ncbi:MAG: alpha/beta hydrolase [Myxococcota bacterium]
MFGKTISNMMVKPHQSPLFDDPASYGVDFEDVSFETSDGVTLRGWLVNGGSDRVIIQTHFGVQCNRAGYDPKGKGLIKMWKTPITFMRQAKYLREKGYSVLLYDLRNHGNSDLGTMPWVSWGPEEAKDVIAAVDYISGRPDYKDASLGLLSICMGAASTTYGYGLEHGLRDRANIKALIAVQPLPYEQFIAAFGMPGFLARAGAKVSLDRTGIDLDSKTFIPEVKHITVPTLVVQNKNDPWSTPEIVQQFYDELQVEKEALWLDLVKQRAAAYDYLGTHPQFIDEFFGKYM